MYGQEACYITVEGRRAEALAPCRSWRVWRRCWQAGSESAMPEHVILTDA